MMLLIGMVLIALGLISGGALVASSMGWVAVTHATTLWIMFPVGSAIGLLIAALDSRTSRVPLLLRFTGSLMFLLAICAVAVLVLGSAGVLTAPQNTAPLWYVFAVGIMVGIANFLAPASPAHPT